MSQFKNMDNLFFNPTEIEDAVNFTIRPKKRGRGNMIKHPNELSQNWSRPPQDAKSVLLLAAYYGTRYYDYCVKHLGKLVYGSDMSCFRAYASKLDPETGSVLATTIADVYRLKIKDHSDFIFQPLVQEFDQLHERYLMSQMPNYTGLILDGRGLDRDMFKEIIMASDSDYTSSRMTIGVYDMGIKTIEHKSDMGIRWFGCRLGIPKEAKKQVGDTPLKVKVVNAVDDLLVLDEVDRVKLDIARRKSDFLNDKHTVLLL